MKHDEKDVFLSETKWNLGRLVTSLFYKKSRFEFAKTIV